MTEQPHQLRRIPGDIPQLQVVWRYELLRYLRSKRLLASIAIVIAILALIYVLPPVAGSPYRGTETNSAVTVIHIPPIHVESMGITIYGYGSLNSNTIDTKTLELFVNGTAYPSNNGANWVYSHSSSIMGIPLSANTILFTQNVTGAVVTASYKWHTPVQDFDTRFISFVSILVVICATFFAADSIVGEYQNRTGYLMFPNPLKRSTLWFGKYAASMTAGIVVVGLFYLGVAVLSILTLGGADDDFGLSFGFALEYLVAVTAIAYLISSIMKGSTGALVLTFFLFVMILPIVDSVSMFSAVKLSASLTFSAGVMSYSMYDPFPKDSVNSDFGITIHQYYPDELTSFVVIMIYAVVAIAISIILFKRKELLG